MKSGIDIFLAGIMQGSLPDTIHEQTYRNEIAEMLTAHLDDVNIFDPFVAHPQSLTYDNEKSRDVFFALMDRAGQSDVVIAFLPEASMGTSIELWSGFHGGAVVVAVTPLVKNWVIISLADKVVPDLAALKEYIASGGLKQLIEQKIGFSQ